MNLLSWLKKSPAKPVYNSSQKKPAQPEGQADGAGAGGNGKDANDGSIIHKFMFFYPAELLIVPEFRFENKTDVLKRKDFALMVQYLELKEEAERKRKAEEAAKETPVAAGGAKGKADPKKAPPKGGGKGAAPTEDKNAPQPITVDYPETPDDANCMIIERSFMETP